MKSVVSFLVAATGRAVVNYLCGLYLLAQDCFIKTKLFSNAIALTSKVSLLLLAAKVCKIPLLR